jgi:2-polyprenyl-3-methyl-5-hydroxy-6-metoxy-1,4-benzoquinol methylase
MSSPGGADAYQVGRFYFHLNEFDKARPWLRQALRARPWRLERLARLAISYLPPRLASSLAGSRRKLWHRLWEDALTLPGFASAHDSAIAELAEYLGISADEAETRCRLAAHRLADEWRAADPKTDESILSFYQQSTSYIADLVHERSKAFGFGGYHAVEAVLLARARGVRSVLDFGGGDGSCGVLYAKTGFDTTVADVSRHLLEFARLRFARRGLLGHFLLLPDQALPERAFDLVTAFDTLEHVTDPLQALGAIHRSLTPGGYLLANTPFGQTEIHPMHIPYDRWAFLRGARTMGFGVERFALREFHLLRKR